MDIVSTNFGMYGEGVGRIDGKVYLVNFLLPNEKAEIKLIENKKNYGKAKIERLISSSPDRVPAPCPYYYECGGCALQHADYKLQLDFKRELVTKTIKKIANLNVEVAQTEPCENQFNYRNKISFNLENGKIGFYKTNSHSVIEIENCLLAKENINIVLQLFKKFIKENPISNKIKNFVVREIENQILVGIVAKEKIKLQKFYELLKSRFKQIGIYLIVNTRKDSVVLSGKATHVGGIKNIEIHNCGLTYFVDLLGFHQTNEIIQNKIYEHVLDLIKPKDVVVNGFSGAGLLSAIVAKKAKQVYGIEINKNSHSSAEKLKKYNKVSNLTNICGDFNKEIKKIKNINTLVLDPAKKGCGEQVLKAISADKIIYISCNPIALAKDLRILEKNYIIKEIKPYDMFPNTNQVESLVFLEKNNSKFKL